MTSWEDVLKAERVGVRRLVSDLPCGVRIYRHNRALVAIPPTTDWGILSSGSFNGGYVSSPSAVFNNTGIGGAPEMGMMKMTRDVHNKYTEECARQIGLDSGTAVGLGTAAHMDNAVIRTVVESGIEVTSAITGGIKGNGGRAGDPASFDELKRYMEPKNGTIIIILIIDADLSEGTMLEAMLTATSAKSGVLADLCGRSIYSKGVATGSGTDQIAVLCNKGSSRKINDASPRSELGKSISKCVMAALSEALDRQTMMNMRTQCNPYVLASRYGITEMSCHDEIRYPFEMKTLVTCRDTLMFDAETAAAVASVLRIADEISWGLVPVNEGEEVCKVILSSILRQSMSDPALKMRFERTDGIVDTLRLALAMKLYDLACEMSSREAVI